MPSGGKFLNKGVGSDGNNKKQNGASPKWVKPLIIVVSVILALIVLIGGGLLIYFKVLLGSRPVPSQQGANPDSSYEDLLAMMGESELAEQIEATEAATEPTIPYSDGNYGKTGKVINILLIGQDSRYGEASKNSDTIILCSLNKETKVLTLTSFLRDSYVKLADYKEHQCYNNKITFAYALGYQWGSDEGAFEMIDNTLINNFGATIDHNIEIDLDCFQQIIDEVGPLRITLDETEVKYLNGLLELHGYERRVEVGENDLYAVSALMYARMRHDTLGGEDGSDMKRTNRQRNVVSAVLNNVRKLSISEINDLAKTVVGFVLTDMSDSEITTYLLEVVPILPYLTIESVQIPINGTYRGTMKDVYGNGNKDAVLEIYDFNKNRQTVEAICAGTELP